MEQQKSSSRLIWWLIGGLALLLVVAVVIGSTFKGGEKGIEVEMATAEQRAITQVVTASGRIQPETEVIISPEISGEIIELRVEEGDEVQAGDVLVRIKPDVYQAQVEQLRAGLLQSQASLSQSRASLASAQQDYDRSKDLFDRGVIAAAEYQTAESQLAIAQAQLEGAQFAVRSAEARLREAGEQLGKATIVAPMSGTVSQLNVELGERVLGTSQMQGTDMMRIAKLEMMELEVEVNENDIVNVGVGDSSLVEVDAYPDQRFRGTVTEIASSARTSATGGTDQVTNFTVKVRVEGGAAAQSTAGGVVSAEVPSGPQPAVRLRPGMSGTVDIFTQTVQNAVAIPIAAVTVRDLNKIRADTTKDEAARAAIPTTEDLRKVVFVNHDGKADMVEVETGIADNTHIEVRRGVQPGAEVVAGPYSAVSRTLKPGDAIRKEDPDASRRRAATASNDQGEGF